MTTNVDGTPLGADRTVVTRTVRAPDEVILGLAREYLLSHVAAQFNLPLDSHIVDVEEFYSSSKGAIVTRVFYKMPTGGMHSSVLHSDKNGSLSAHLGKIIWE